ncbi:hypothetical protein WA026_013974 [Henosepilachna vigintioctopunctata]|uniref:Uncharacterized protein n=1 Tax=Henosepilachna vigintioctopunctata TaxID=420089 RepID=A0AAW1U259_9CUCU
MATTTISFYCVKKETLVDLKLSPADAERALTDSGFADKLLTETLNQQSGPSTSAIVDNDLSLVQKTWCNPVAVASSTGLSVKTSETNKVMRESDSGCSIKSNKSQIATLLAKRLKQKEDHEEQRMIRHKERMEMDEKFLKVLEKLANK